MSTVNPTQHALEVVLDPVQTSSSSFAVHVLLPASIQATHGAVATIAASSTTTIGMFKSLLANVTGVSVTAQHLFFGDIDLTTGEDHRTFGDNRVVSGSTLNLIDVTSSSFVVVEVPEVLQDRFGKSMIFRHPATTVTSLQNTGAAALGLQVADFELSYSSSTLPIGSCHSGVIQYSECWYHCCSTCWKHATEQFHRHCRIAAVTSTHLRRDTHPCEFEHYGCWRTHGDHPGRHWTRTRRPRAQLW